MALWRKWVLLVIIASCGALFMAKETVLSEVSVTVMARVSARPVPEPATQLLVLVIAGGTKKPYTELRKYWHAIADKVRSSGIVIYLVSFNSSLTETLVDTKDHRILFPGTDSLIPGVLNQTIMAMELIAKQKLPGSDFKSFLRTNLSSFWRFDVLLQFLARMRDSGGPLYAGFRYSYPGYPVFAAGAGFVLNQQAYSLILSAKNELRFTEIDDVAIGRLMEKKGVSVAYTFKICWLEHRSHMGANFEFPACTKHQFHYRVKTLDPVLDIEAWTHLYNKFVVGRYGASENEPQIELPTPEKAAEQKEDKKVAQQ